MFIMPTSKHFLDEAAYLSIKTLFHAMMRLLIKHS